MKTVPPPARPRAVLVGVQLPGVDDRAHTNALAELARLVETLGLDVVGTISQRRKQPDAGVVLGEGKLVGMTAWTGGSGVVERAAARRRTSEDADDDTDEAPLPSGGPEASAVARRADVIVVDHDLSPIQMRNLASATGADVLDRTGVIVEIFHRHASSREARLQVEMARLKYVAPRLRFAGQGGFDRQGGGIGAKGSGESQLELDRRKIRDRIAEIRRELEEVEAERRTRRVRRQQAHRVAFVGYTNAGKSSWMRALTGSEVLVADKLFATLDTTVRVMVPETRPRILLSDTVGFIDKLPHDLVASFRSTLDEAHEASLLVFVVDASDPDFPRQLAVTRQVIGEIGAGETSQQLWLNKVDRLDEAGRAALAEAYPDAHQVSARDPDCVARMHQQLWEAFAAAMPEFTLVVPYGASGVLGELREKATVLEEAYEEGGVRYRLRAPPAVAARLQRLVSDGAR